METVRAERLKWHLCRPDNGGGPPTALDGSTADGKFGAEMRDQFPSGEDY